MPALRYPGHCTIGGFQQRALLARGPGTRLSRRSPVLRASMQMLSSREALSDLSLEETTFLGSCDRLGSHIATLPTLGHHMSLSLAVTGTTGGLTEPRHIPQHSLNPEKALGTMAVDWLMENKFQTQALSSPGMSREQGGRGQLSPCPRLFWLQDTGHWFWNQHVATPKQCMARSGVRWFRSHPYSVICWLCDP